MSEISRSATVLRRFVGGLLTGLKYERVRCALQRRTGGTVVCVTSEPVMAPIYLIRRRFTRPTGCLYNTQFDTARARGGIAQTGRRSNHSLQIADTTSTNRYPLSYDSNNNTIDSNAGGIMVRTFWFQGYHTDGNLHQRCCTSPFPGRRG
jgi:hypothetical protein